MRRKYFKVEYDNNDISLNKNEWNEIISLTGIGEIKDLLINFSRNYVQVKITVDGNEIFTIDLADYHNFSFAKQEHYLFKILNNGKQLHLSDCFIGFMNNFKVLAKPYRYNTKLKSYLTCYRIEMGD